MSFIRIPGGRHAIGWRFDELLSAEVNAGLESFVPRTEFLVRFSEAREVELPAFEIAAQTREAEALLGDLDDERLEELSTLEDLCNALDDALRPEGLRLPTEDELEAAFGGRLFPWGTEVPDGDPWPNKTAFTGHQMPIESGLHPNPNPYQVEITRHAFKLGDGGEALCGAYPWPVAWMALSPSYRLAGDDVEDLLFEFLEEARVRPVRL